MCREQCISVHIPNDVVCALERPTVIKEDTKPHTLNPFSGHIDAMEKDLLNFKP